MVSKLLVPVILFFNFSSTAQVTNRQPAQYNMTGVLWHQHSGEYKALCYQAFNLARLRLQEILRTNKDSTPLAIVTDVDETVLDNSPSAGHDILAGHLFTDTSWRVWVDLAAAKPLPGAVEFFNYAAQHGVQVFYITNRKEAEKASTMKNLQLQGFPQADEQHMLMKSSSSDKQPRRQQVANRYNIVLLLGDNLNDFDDLFFERATAERNANVDMVQSYFGSKYIMLPNAVYGDWEGALWQGRKLSSEEKDKMKWAVLLGY